MRSYTRFKYYEPEDGEQQQVRSLIKKRGGRGIEYTYCQHFYICVCSRWNGVTLVDFVPVYWNGP